MPQEYSHAIILDFEATCADRERIVPQEIIEFPSVLISLETMQPVDEFTSFVRPFHNSLLTRFCRELTSITQADVDAAPLFLDVLSSHGTWLEKHGLSETNSLFVTCGDWDLGTMLPAQCKTGPSPVESLLPIYTRWLNIKVLYFEALKRKASGMAGMLRGLGIPLSGTHHRGIDDCRNIAKIFQALVAKGVQIEATSRLPIEKFPPVNLLLRYGETSKSVVLQVRSLRRLRGLATRQYKRQILSITRLDGTSLEENDQLRQLTPGEELLLE